MQVTVKNLLHRFLRKLVVFLGSPVPYDSIGWCMCSCTAIFLLAVLLVRFSVRTVVTIPPLDAWFARDQRAVEAVVWISRGIFALMILIAASFFARAMMIQWPKVFDKYRTDER